MKRQNQRAVMERVLEQHLGAWRTAAAQPQGRATLEAGCREALTQARTTMSAYECQW